MTLTDRIPGRRDRKKPRHRADDRIAELKAQHETEMEALREENVALLNMKAAADDHFMLMADLVTNLEDDVRRLREELAAEQGVRAVAEKDVETRGRWIADLEQQLADAKRRLEIGVLAEAAAARTQEIPVITRVLPLPESPLTAVDTAQLAALKARGDRAFGPVTNPGHVATT
jgi:multidrug efflux pump subunit AcrA (membrane-fusion protein)